MSNTYDIYSNLLRIKDLTNYRVSKDIGISQAVLSNWKTGRNEPSPDVLIKLADYLDVTVDYLLGREIDDAETELNDYLEELKNRSEMRMLFKVSKNATKEDIEKTVKMLEAWGYKDDGDCEGC